MSGLPPAFLMKTALHYWLRLKPARLRIPSKALLAQKDFCHQMRADDDRSSANVCSSTRIPEINSPSQPFQHGGWSGEQGQKLNSEERCEVPNMARRGGSGAKTLPSDLHIGSLPRALSWGWVRAQVSVLPAVLMVCLALRPPPVLMVCLVLAIIDGQMRLRGSLCGPVAR